MRRVVITGLGLVTPLGVGAGHVWTALLAGKSGAKRITEFDVSDMACQIAGVVPRGSAPGQFNADDWMEPKEQRKVDDFIVYAVSAADQAISDSGWSASSEEERVRAGVLIGSGIGGLQGIEKSSILLQEKGPRRISPFFIPGRLINLARRLRLDQTRAQGSKSCRGYSMLDRRPRHRRRGAPNRARRCRRDGGWRRRKLGLPAWARWVCRLPRAFHRLQRPARAGIEALRPRPRRLRHGRRGGRRRA